MEYTEIPAGHRSGFVALAGRPNVGKSTLLNQIMGQQIAAVSPRPQMTRQKQLGILTLPEAQIIFMDTPGLHFPLHTLGKYMNAEARQTLQDCDLILMLFDLNYPPSKEDENVIEVVNNLEEDTQVLAVLNKVDLVEQEDLSKRKELFVNLMPEITAITVSATTGENIDELMDAILARLPEGPRFYAPETITDTYERDIAADMIRAAALEYLREEVPYCIAVRIDTYSERDEHGAYIEATIFVERESQKGIVIGQGGKMLKRIGTWARRAIESATGRKVYLQLRVKVLPGWRNDENQLRRFGFTAEPE
ncbi:MAG: GTPase Era [Anaerolineales bacterium]|jgi:GTP-binding protein Era